MQADDAVAAGRQIKVFLEQWQEMHPMTSNQSRKQVTLLPPRGAPTVVRAGLLGTQLSWPRPSSTPANIMRRLISSGHPHTRRKRTLLEPLNALIEGCTASTRPHPRSKPCKHIAPVVHPRTRAKHAHKVLTLSATSIHFEGCIISQDSQFTVRNIGAYAGSVHTRMFCQISSETPQKTGNVPPRRSGIVI